VEGGHGKIIFWRIGGMGMGNHPSYYQPTRHTLSLLENKTTEIYSLTYSLQHAGEVPERRRRELTPLSPESPHPEK